MIGGGSPRVPQPADRRAVQPRPEQIRRAPEGPIDSDYAPNPAQRPVSQNMPLSSQKSNKRLRLVGVAILLVALLLAGFFIWSSLRGSEGSEIDKNKHQAVFFSSGQVYFGKLEVVNKQYLKLSGVFYVQSDGAGQAAESENPQAAGNNMQLIKLGDEVHGPEDTMVINRDQVLFFENLKPDGKVSKLIGQYESRK